MSQRAELLEAEVQRLLAERRVIDAQWGKRWRLLGFGVLTVPAYVLLGLPWAVITLVCTPALVGVQSYLLWVRGRECDELLAETRRTARALARKTTTNS